MSLKLGIVGAGRMTQIAHLPSLAQMSGVDVVALADVDAAALERTAAAFHIPRVYANAEDLLAGEAHLDGVLVVTPRMHHASACVPILERGLPVFLEKPLEVTPDKGREIVAAAERGRTFVLVGYHNRYDPAYRLAQSLLQSGEIGEFQYLHIQSFGGLWMGGALPPASLAPEAEREPAGAPPKPQSRDGKSFPAEVEWVEGWIHEINLARGLCGEAKRVSYASNDMPRLALVEFERARALFEVGLISPPGSRFSCQLMALGRGGRLDLDFAAPLLFRQPSELRLTTPQGVRLPAIDYRESFVEELVHFLRCILGREQPQTSAADALRDVELCFDIVRKGGGLTPT